MSVRSERRKRQAEGLPDEELVDESELPIEAQDIKVMVEYLSQPKPEREFRSWLKKQHIHTKEEGGNE